MQSGRPIEGVTDKIPPKSQAYRIDPVRYATGYVGRRRDTKPLELAFC